MCIVLLIFLLLIDLVIALIVYNKRLTSISIWTSGMFLFSAIAYAINISYFGSDISLLTVFLIESCVIAYFVGEIIANRHIFYIKRKKRTIEVENKNAVVIPNNVVIIFFVLGIIGATAYRFYDMYIFAYQKGIGNIFNLISFIRPYINDGIYETSTISSVFASFSEATAYIFAFYFLYNGIICGKYFYRLIWPVLSYFIFLITTTGRTGYLRFFIITIGIMYILLKNKNTSNVDYRFSKYVIIIGIIMISVFYFYGSFFRNSTRTISEYFANYFSAGIKGLDSYINDQWSENTYFGQYTLSNIYYYINKIFNTTFLVEQHNLPFFSWEKSQSNIYTGLVLPLQDYGIIGLLFTRIGIGILYTNLERYIMSRKECVSYYLNIIVFGYFLYINFSIPIADRFIEFLTVTTFPSLIIFLIVINKIFKKYKRYS